MPESSDADYADAVGRLYVVDYKWVKSGDATTKERSSLGEVERIWQRENPFRGA